MSLDSVHGLQYVCLALALGGKIRCSVGDLGGRGAGAYTMWDLVFSFFNGIPYMTESDKKKTPSVWTSAWRGSWAQDPGRILEAALSGLCWVGSSVGPVGSASVVCACTWRGLCR